MFQPLVARVDHYLPRKVYEAIKNINNPVQCGGKRTVSSYLCVFPFIKKALRKPTVETSVINVEKNNKIYHTFQTVLELN